MSEPAQTSRYETLAKIATGGMATVFVGRARGASGFSRMVALKRPHPFVAADPALRKSLEEEARLAAMLHHAHVVSVLDVEAVGDDILLVLDYVEGGTLAEIARRATELGQPLSERVAIRIILDVASGLGAAHALRDASGSPLGIVHRDVSPQNVLVGLDGLARLSDFGIAKSTSQERDRTATDVIKGKLAYLPPEYLQARRFDARSDQFALAVVAWETLTGKRLFRGATELETMRAIVEGKPARLAELRPDLAAIDPIIARGLAASPEDRFAGVHAFAEELEEAARLFGWVASHAEVAAVVEATAGETVRARRKIIESSAPRSMRELDAPSARDAIPTVSVAMPAAPQSGTPSGVVDVSVVAALPPRRRRWPLALVVALVLGAGGAAAFFLLPRGARSAGAEPSAAPAAAPPSTGAPAPSVAPPPARSEATVSPPPMTTAAPRPGTRPLPAHPSASPATPIPSRAPPNPYGN